jgi:uncharacterized protein (DUF1778 family)
MATKNPRINVTFEESTANMITHIARKEKKPVARFVRDLALEALELREEFHLSKIAKGLDKPKAKKIKHEIAWK